MNALGKKWMSKHLYEHCPICDGAGAIDPHRTDLRLNPPSAAAALKPDPSRTDGWLICPGCGGVKFIQVGLTVGQVEKMRAKADRWDSHQKGLEDNARQREIKTVNAEVRSITESFADLRAAGGSAWDQVPDPAAYLGREPDSEGGTG